MLGKIICSLSLIISVVSILFFFVHIFIKKGVSTKALSIILLILSLSLAVFSYFIEPNNTHDLSRYFTMLEDLKDKNLEYLFKEFKYKSAPLTAIWFYIISKSGLPHLITTLPTLISMCAISYVVIDIYRNSKEKRFNNFALVFLVMFAFLELVMILSTVRYWTALSIILIAIYRDVVKKKRNWLTILIYILPIFVHNGIVVVLFFRVLTIINWRRFNLLFFLSYPIILVTKYILNILDIYMLKEVEKMLSDYISMWKIDIRFIICNALICLIIILIYLLSYLIELKNREEKFSFKAFFYSEKYNKDYVTIDFLMIMIGFVFCSQFIRRINIVCYCLALPVLYQSINLLEHNKDMKFFNMKVSILNIIIKIGLLIALVGMMIYQYANWNSWGLICF